MRAREPDEQGYIDRDGVKIGYETFGFLQHDEQRPTVVFVPVDSIVNSRAWKAQVPYLAQHYRVVTIDPRGNGRSDRPTDPAAYDDLAFVDDTVAVLDHLGVDKAVLVGICVSAWHALLVASLHADRVLGVVGVAPWIKDTTPPLSHRLEAAERFDDELESYDGWYKTNRHFWRDHWSDYADFFFGQLLPEPHSTKQFEDVTGFARETTADCMLAEDGSRRYTDSGEEGEALLRSLTQPVLVIQGTDDRCQPQARMENLARLTEAEHLVIEGAGHLPMARHPIVVNRAIKRFVDRVTAAPSPPRRWTTSWQRRPRLLYLSSPIGLGHARRDLAIADAIRAQRPDLEVEWLTQSPVAEFLERRGETVHPASRRLASESGHFESESGEHDLHAFQAVRRMDELLVNNFMVFDDLVEHEAFDLWVGDEAWDLDYFLHENPELKRAPFVWMTDFVGWMPMPDGGDREAVLTADYNAEMVEQVARYPRLRDRSVFVGDPDDVVDRPLGPGLPARGPGPRSTSTSPGTSWASDPIRLAGTRCASGSGMPKTSGVRRQRRRVWGRRAPAAPCGRGLPARAGTCRRPAHGRCGRTAHRSSVAGCPSRRGGARLSARPGPASRGLRRGRGPGRPQHDDGADRRRSTVPLLPARAPFRAAGPCTAPAGAASRRPGDGLPRRDA